MAQLPCVATDYLLFITTDALGFLDAGEPDEARARLRTIAAELIRRRGEDEMRRLDEAEARATSSLRPGGNPAGG